MEPHVSEQVDALVHGLLSPEEAKRIEDHCASCETCRAALDQARKRYAALASVPAHEHSEQLISSTLQRVEDYEQRRKRWHKRMFKGIGLALAASVLILAGFHIYFLNL